MTTTVSRVSRRRLPLFVASGLILIILLTASGIARLFTDYLFFDQLGFASSWARILLTQIMLAVVFTAAFFAILFGNLTVADRLRPPVRPPSPEEDLIERYHQLVGRHGTRVRLVVSGFLALMFGLQVSQEWKKWILFTNANDFGWTDPLHGLDASFYVFRLPFLTFLVDWLSFAVVFSVFASALAHYLNGGIRAVAVSKISDRVKLHLSVLMALLGVLRAISYYLDRFELVNSRRGLFDGALATDVEVQLPALNLLVLVSLLGAALFVVNLRRNGWGLPLVALGMWAVTHVVVGGIFPGLYQRFAVEPNQSTREAQYIAGNLEATRFAYGLDANRVASQQFDYAAGITTAEVEANEDILDDILVLDPVLAQESFIRNQAERRFYAFNDLDIDRYAIDGTIEPVAISVRELILDEVDSGWENQHLAFTHGYGVALAPANVFGSGGTPDYLVSGIGPAQQVDESLAVGLSQPRIYFGEDFGGYAIVGADGRNEVDFASDSVGRDESDFRYDGDGGVAIDSLLRQLAFSLRFQSINPLISPFVGSESSVIYNRDVVERVALVAPFLELDSDPYPILSDGRVKWVIDAYTTTNEFPYSQGVRNRSLPGSSDLSGGYNYVRNSAKAVIDAYDGNVTIHVADETDPIIRAYRSAFPALFSDAPPSLELRQNFRYPKDIFSIQTDMWGTYQVTDPVTFLEGSLSWTVATQPQAAAGDQRAGAATAALPMAPQYVLTRLPGSDRSEFILQRAFVPSSNDANRQSDRPELTAIMVGRSDPEVYGQLIQYRLPGGLVNAPDLVDSEIRRETEISEYITPLDLQGSNVLFGEMIMVLIEDTLVYVRPLYVEAQGNNAVPELNRIIAVNGDRIAMRRSLDEAVRAVTTDAGEEPETPTVPVPDPPEITAPELPPNMRDLSVSDLIDLADDFLVAADQAAENGDLVEAARLRADARIALAQVTNLLTGRTT